MNTNVCNNCGVLCEVFKFSQPSELKKAINVIKSNIVAGIINESKFWPEQELKQKMTPFHEIKENGPWDDIIIHYFECKKCAQLFKFSAETYHGRGGSWQPINKNRL
jgi:hypothetical protein